MPVTKMCRQCRQPFTVPPSRAAREHCSRACGHNSQAERQRKPLVTSVCGICRRPFSYARHGTVERLYCSPACLAVSRQGREPPNKLARRLMTCGYCSNPIQVPAGGYRPRRFCSRACTNAANIGTTPWNKARQSLCCEWCCQSFAVAKGRLKTARFCSEACHHAWKGSISGPQHPLWIRVQRTCEWCRTPFFAKPAKVAIGEARFCSRQCVGAFTSSRQQGRTSSIEHIVFAILTSLGEPFEAQKGIGPWLVDFYLPARHLVLECDGTYWHSLPARRRKDAQKDGWLTAHGYRVVRLDERTIHQQAMTAVSEAIA